MNVNNLLVSTEPYKYDPNVVWDLMSLFCIRNKPQALRRPYLSVSDVVETDRTGCLRRTLTCNPLISLLIGRSGTS